MGITNHHRVQEYINQVCLHIKNRKVHDEIKIEILGHIEENVIELLSSGVAEDEAVEKAVAQMGDAEVVGRQLHKIHKTQPEWSVLVITILFAIIGLTLMYLIESKVALLYNNEVFRITMITTVLGMFAAGGLYFIDYRKIQAHSKHIYIGTMLMLIFALHSGLQVHGVRAWLSIGPITINLVIASPFLFITALAGLYDGWDWNDPKKFLIGLALGIAPALLMIAAPSLSACITYLTAFTILTVVSGIKLKHILLVAGFGIGLLLYLGIISLYRIERLLILLYPAKDPKGMGWQSMQVYNAIHSAGLLGQGFNFDPKALPEVHLHYIFTYIVYTFGWIAGGILAALIIAFLIRITRIAVATRNRYGKLLVSGFVAAFSVQFIWNILLNLNLAPRIGFLLPFISFGGPQFVINMIAVGIILNVYKFGRVPKSVLA